MRKFAAGDRVKIAVVCDYGGSHWVETEVVEDDGETMYQWNGEWFVNVRSPNDWSEVTAVGVDRRIKRIK